MSRVLARSTRASGPGPDAAASTPAARKFTLADISSKSESLPGRYAYYALQGFGKTSFLTHANAPIFLMTRGETGLLTLMDNKQVPPTPHLPEILSWQDLIGAVEFLRSEKHDRKTLVIDTANGAERLLHEYICERDFDGDWTDKGFMGYMRGYEVALADWRLLLNALDALRREKSMVVWFLMHSRIKTFKNPNGADYDRYTPEMHEKTWGVTRGWLDTIIFGQTEVTVKAGARVADVHKKGKVEGSGVRVICTNSDNPTYEAKNRMGLPEVIELGDTSAEDWKLFAEQVRKARESGPEGKVTESDGK